ncbi:TPA: restriction endonuclease subunit S [Photobacterium damselae]
MKDSGVDWLGQIPEHWEVLPLTKYSTRVDYRGKTPEKVGEGRFLLTTKNLKNGFIDYKISREYINENQYKQVMSRGKPEVGDLLFTMEAPLGASAIVDDRDVAIAQRIIKFRLNNKRFVSHYVNYFFQSQLFQQYIKSLGTGSTALGIKASKLCMIKLLAPSIKEQIDIVERLSTDLDNLDQMLLLLDRQIKKYVEYKATLINSAVTGKIKVTELA